MPFMRSHAETNDSLAGLAQVVEHTAENRGVPSASLGPGAIFL